MAPIILWSAWTERVADVFCAGAAAEAAAAGCRAGRRRGGFGRRRWLGRRLSFGLSFLKTGISPACHSMTTSIRLNMPPIIRQMKSSMMPSIPLVSKPLLMSQTIPQIESRINSAHRALSSIQLDLGFISDSLPTAVATVIGPTYPESSSRAEAECGRRWRASATWRGRWSGSDSPRRIPAAARYPKTRAPKK